MLELTFGQVEAIASSRHYVAHEKVKTFRARLQQLQRIGVPEGVNVGKGGRARYGTTQLSQIMIALDLLDVGMPPERVAALVIGQWNELRQALSYVLRNKDERVYLMVFPRALGHLSDDASAREAESICLPVTGTELCRRLTSRDGQDWPVAILDLVTLFRAMTTPMALVLPNAPAAQNAEAALRSEILDWWGASGNNPQA